MRELCVRTAEDGAILSVPNAINAITTYVLLEQEAWFEKEVAFVRRCIRPGMTAIDIGANLGVYSIPMARQAGLTGAVYAYEPTSETRTFLNRSAVLNGCANLHIIPAAVSNQEGEAHLVFGTSSELNALGASGSGERVRLTTLDHEDATRQWSSPDFIKIDAEGEEQRILQGGSRFFARHSPLVMFEIQAGTTVNHHLRHDFSTMGYSLYRLLAGEPVLVPDSPDAPNDGFELNLFAAKADRATKLAAAGLLAEKVPTWQPDAAARREALQLIGRHPFGASLVAVHADGASLDPQFRDGLAAYNVWRTAERPLDVRCAALNFAFSTLQGICRTHPSLPRLSTLARVAREAGQRLVCVNTLAQLFDRLSKGDVQIQEPFWPACSRFDAIDPGEDKGAWFVCSACEGFERARSFSSIFAVSKLDLKSLCTNPFASAEMERRWILQLALAGKLPKVPARLRAPAADHVNADIWSTGGVPNTAGNA
jgi:FkbM family methyltransferase